MASWSNSSSRHVLIVILVVLFIAGTAAAKKSKNRNAVYRQSSYYQPSFVYSASDNLALHKRSFQSSQGDDIDDLGWGLPFKANDGQFHPWLSTSGTAGRGTSWWAVDLGESMDVGTVVVFPQLDEEFAFLNYIEIRVGDVEPTKRGDQNPLCADKPAGDAYVDDDEEYPSVKTFLCGSNTRGRYVTVRMTKRSRPLHLNEVMVMSPSATPESTLKPRVAAEGACPGPLAGACAEYESQGMSKEDAALKAFMEGPVACEKGFWCKVQPDEAGINGGMTGTFGDDFYGNENFAFCSDPNFDNEDQTSGGHCHGSPYNSVYSQVLHDHFYRPYRGTLECCCSMDGWHEEVWEEEDEMEVEKFWVPAKGYLGRCDYRGLDGNDADFNFEDGCEDVDEIIPEGQYPLADQCWTVDHFAHPAWVAETPSYSTLSLEVLSCEGDECSIKLSGREPEGAWLLASESVPSTEPSVIEEIEDCMYVHGMMLPGEPEMLEFAYLQRDMRPSEVSLTYQGCYKNKSGRRSGFVDGPIDDESTLHDCVWVALEEGFTTIGLQSPNKHEEDGFVDCYIGSKGVIGGTSRKHKQMADSKCKIEDWTPEAYEQSFEFHGGRREAAVYNIEHSGARMVNVGAGKTVYVQVLDPVTCTLSQVFTVSN